MGGIERLITGKPMAGEKPDRQNFGNPYTNDLLARLLASIDDYKDRTTPGWRAHVPSEQRPYEWRSDEERGGIRQRETEQADRENRPERPFAINEENRAGQDDPLPEEDAEDSGEQLAASTEKAAETTEATQNRDEAIRTAYQTARKGEPMRIAQMKAPPAAPGPYSEQAEKLRRYIYGGR